MLIRYWSVLERSDTISVTSMKLKDSQISKNQKAKALRELEDSGLILVEEFAGEKPDCTNSRGTSSRWQLL